MTISAQPSPARKRSARRMSSGRSPTTTIAAVSAPSSSSASDSHGPLRSETRPVSTSVPVTTMPARTLTALQTGRLLADSGWRPPRGVICMPIGSADGATRCERPLMTQPHAVVAERQAEALGAEGRACARPAASVSPSTSVWSPAFRQT